MYIPPVVIFNYIKDNEDKRDFSLSIAPKGTFNESVSSKYVDWTDTMSSVKDQGRLGSCVGFAVTAMKEWQEQQEHMKEVAEGKSYRRKQDQYDLSEQWIYYKCKEIDPWPNQEGTSIRYAMKVLNKIGVPCEEAWKYDDRFKGKPKSWANLISRWGLIESYWRVNNLSELKTALLDGPVTIGIGCFEEIFNVGSDGIVKYPKDPDNILGGHAVCAVGFDDNKGMVSFKNSWSRAWGKKGYGFLSYKYINNFMWDAWCAKDLSVDKSMLKGEKNL